MKITFVLPPVRLSGGIRVIAIYARELHARGHEVTLISVPRPNRPLKDRMKSLLKGNGWPSGDETSEPSHLDDTPVAHRVLTRYRPVTDADVPDGDIVIATWW